MSRGAKCHVTEDMVTTNMSAEELVRRGYRRTSNAWCMVSRIDRADWVRVLAKQMNLAVADYYNPEGELSYHWIDYYRRTLSKDKHTVSPTIIGKIPSSIGDNTGYVLMGDFSE